MQQPRAIAPEFPQGLFLLNTESHFKNYAGREGLEPLKQSELQRFVVGREGLEPLTQSELQRFVVGREGLEPPTSCL